MGGAKCSYKNCTIRSDRQTHMFQYPVLDRPRCHQWLINSNKFDYLSLTVSQLKNRRICQHHFTPDSFMNETMSKLKPNAIPTLDGDYCDLEDIPIKDPKMESFDSVVFEDIENLKYPRRYLDKDTFSKRYSNFLTDTDMVDEDTVKDKGDSNISHPILLPKSYMSLPKHTPKINPVKRKAQPEIKAKPKDLKQFDHIIPSTANTLKKKDENNYSPPSMPVVKATKIQIISEEQITDPVPVHGTLKPVKPNTVLCLPKRKKKNTQNPNQNTETNYTLSIDDKMNITIKEHNNTNDLKLPKTKDVNKTIEIEVPSLDTKVADYQNKSLDVSNCIELNPTIETKTLSIAKNQKSLLKDKVQDSDRSPRLSSQKEPQPAPSVKMSSDRAMAIQKKRNFNRRLRDMISFQMDLTSLSPTKTSFVEDITNHQDENKTINMNTSQHDAKEPFINDSALSLSTPTTSKKPTNIQVKSHLSEDKSLPNLQSYKTLDAIVARMKHMEDLLLTKIEQNTQTIVKLKKSVEENCLKQYSAVSTQTDRDELTNKKTLYREISQYLTSDAKSLIYEQLFLNKLESTKRRKIR